MIPQITAAAELVEDHHGGPVVDGDGIVQSHLADGPCETHARFRRLDPRARARGCCRRGHAVARAMRAPDSWISSGIRASRRLAGSSVRASGRYKAKSIGSCSVRVATVRLTASWQSRSCRPSRCTAAALQRSGVGALLEESRVIDDPTTRPVPWPSSRRAHGVLPRAERHDHPTGHPA